jgi:tellurite resistance protein
MWGMALFALLWVAQTLGRIRDLPFGVPHWGMSFPLAALAALTLRLAEPQGLLSVLGPLALALASIVIVMLSVATVRGLREGTLLMPEPVATITPVAAAPAHPPAGAPGKPNA